MVNVVKLQQAAGILSEQTLEPAQSPAQGFVRRRRAARGAESDGSMSAVSRCDRCRDALRRTRRAAAQLADARRGSCSNRRSTRFGQARAHRRPAIGTRPASNEGPGDLLGVGGVWPGDHRARRAPRAQQVVPAHRNEAPARRRRRPPTHKARRARPTVSTSSTWALRPHRPPALRRSKGIRDGVDKSAATLSNRCGWRGTSNSSSPAFVSAQLRSAPRAPAPPRRRGCCRQSTQASAKVASPRSSRPVLETGSPSRMSNFTLPTTRVRDRVGADRDESFGVLGGLRARRVVFAATASREQRAEAAIARHGFRAEPCAREHDGNAAAPAFVKQIRPQLRLHDDRKQRPHPREESAHAARRVVGQDIAL